MSLKTLRVERFRGVRSAEISFEAGTTVIFGENDSGRSSLLEALSLALSPFGDERPRLLPGQVHRAVDEADSGNARLELVIGEDRAGAWDRPEFAALAPLLGARSARARTVVLEMTGGPGPGTELRWEIRGPVGRPLRDDVAALAAVRRLNPIVWLRGGSLVDAHGAAGPERAETDGLLERYRRLFAGDAVVQAGALASASAETSRLLDAWAPDSRKRRPAVRPIVAEILERDVTRKLPVAAATDPSPAPPPGSAAQQLAISLVVARLVEDLRRASAPGAKPLLVVEDPEAHLHPMTLATVWSLFERFGTQRIVTSNSGLLLSAAPLRSLRRLTRDAKGTIRQWRVRRDALRAEDMRKVGYHLRMLRGVACFARCWLLVEGQTEHWVLPDLARLQGLDLAQQGVVCVEFAQCGLQPLVKLARELGIEWHVLVDGDKAGRSYAASVHSMLDGADPATRVTRLADRDIEHSFWREGHSSVFQRLAGTKAREGGASPSRLIETAIERHSKPGVAFELLASVADKGIGTAPPELLAAIAAAVRLARAGNA